MKKTLLLLSLATIITSSTAFAHPTFDKGQLPKCCPPSHKECCCQQHPPKVNLEEALSLTEEQKAKAKELRMETREQMRPIIQAIRTKQEQKEIIKRNRNMTAEAQCEMVEKLNNEINALRKQAHDLRIKNDKDFESILTAKQKAEFAKLKEQAKKERCKELKKGHPQEHKK